MSWVIKASPVIPQLQEMFATPTLNVGDIIHLEGPWDLTANPQVMPGHAIILENGGYTVEGGSSSTLSGGWDWMVTRVMGNDRYCIQALLKRTDPPRFERKDRGIELRLFDESGQKTGPFTVVTQ